MKTPGNPGVFCILRNFVVHFWCTFRRIATATGCECTRMRRGDCPSGGAKILHLRDGSSIWASLVTASGVTRPRSLSQSSPPSGFERRSNSERALSPVDRQLQRRTAPDTHAHNITVIYVINPFRALGRRNGQQPGLCLHDPPVSEPVPTEYCRRVPREDGLTSGEPKRRLILPY